MITKSQEIIQDWRKHRNNVSENVIWHIWDIALKIEWIHNDNNWSKPNGIFWNKSLNLMNLERNGFLVPKTIFLSTDFFKNKPLEFDVWFINFPKPWIVRSACLEEDNFSESNAWRYKSIVVNWWQEELNQAIKDVTNHARSVWSTPSLMIQEYIEWEYYWVWFSRFLADNNAYLPIVEYSWSAQAVTWWIEKVKRYHFLWASEELELSTPDDFLWKFIKILKSIELIKWKPQDIEFAVKWDDIYVLQTRDCVDTLQSWNWWYWTAREKTPIFPCIFRAQVSQDYINQYWAKNQYILVVKDWKTYMFYNKNDIKSFQQTWVDRLNEFKETHISREKEFKKRLKALIDYSKSMLKDTDFLSTEDIIERLNQYNHLYSRCVDISNEAFLWWFVLEKYLRTWIDSKLEWKDIWITNSQVFNQLSVSNKSSWTDILRESLRKLSTEISQNAKEKILSNDFDWFIEWLKNDWLYKKWKNIFWKYNWIGFNWIWPWICENNMFDLMKSILKDISRKDYKDIDKKEEIYKLLWFKENEKYLFDLLWYMIYLKDWRNWMYSMASYNFYEWLIKLCKERNIDIKHLYNKWFNQVKDYISWKNNIATDLESVTVWSNMGWWEIVLNWKEAEDFMKKMWISLDEEIEIDWNILKWEPVSQWFVKWKAKYLREWNANYGKDDIIVASSIHPTETWIISNVWWIIVEEWWITSHISIIAREAWIPCVINLKNAKKIIKEWDEIILDANKWNVHIL